MKGILIDSNKERDIFFLGLDISKGEYRVQLRIESKGLLVGNNRNQYYLLRRDVNQTCYHVLIYKQKFELPKTLGGLIDTFKLYTNVLKEETVEQSEKQI